MSDQNPIIFIDALGIDKPGGARTAVLGLFNALIQIRSDWDYVTLVSQEESSLAQYPYVTQINLPVSKGLLARSLAQIIVPYLSWKMNVNLVHFTKSQGAIVPGIKSVLTLFDVTTLRYPEIHKKHAVLYWRYIQPVIARHTNAIVTLTNDAARDIHQLLHVPMEKINVIPCASQFSGGDSSPEIDFETVRKHYRLPDDYMLFVGALALKKNLPTLINALGIMQDNRDEFPPLVLVGPRYKQSDANDIFRIIRNLNLEKKVIYIGQVSTSELPLIYQNATIFLLPSVHEGFGIPALEAMVSKTPLVASRSSALPEVVGEAGWLVDEYLSPAAWAKCITNLLKSPSARSELVRKGIVQVSKFSWENSAQKLAALYEQLLKSH